MNGINVSANEASEFFMIVQKGREAFADQEKLIVEEMGIEDYHFDLGNGIYRFKDDAIAVAKELIKRMPHLKLGVVSGIAG
jgi:hypothetical protein